ncbi:hypothetical protein [Streptomyces cinereoruber]|uniref:hypothetical protein n=1 Tax=Streptomyces cinereoruber TaxID=67260 RepID=UPI00363863A5
MASMSRPLPDPQHHPAPAVVQLGQLLDRMRVAGDIRAVLHGRRARRTLQEMAPGYERQPILRLAPALAGTGSARGE